MDSVGCATASCRCSSGSKSLAESGWGGGYPRLSPGANIDAYYAFELPTSGRTPAGPNDDCHRAIEREMECLWMHDQYVMMWIDCMQANPGSAQCDNYARRADEIGRECDRLGDATDRACR